MSHRRRVLLAASVLLAGGLAACSDVPTGGSGGTGEMRVTLVSPNGPEGSAVLEVTSGEILDVAPAGPGVRVYLMPGDPPRVVVVRRDPGDVELRILARDVADPPAFGVVEVGGPDDALRPALGGYSVAVGRGGAP